MLLGSVIELLSFAVKGKRLQPSPLGLLSDSQRTLPLFCDLSEYRVKVLALDWRDARGRD